jgi:hypothetical protein
VVTASRFPWSARVLLAAGAIAMLADVPAADAHPIHTTMSELTLDASRRTVTVQVRMYADDFGATVARRTGARLAADGAPPADAALAYLSHTLVLTDSAGRPLPLAWCGARRIGDAIVVCVRGTASAPLRPARLRNALLFDAFADQVNVVRVSSDGRTRTLIFTRGDDARALP